MIEIRCCLCKKMKINGKWVIAKPQGEIVSDSYCPDCFKAEMLKIKNRGKK